MQSIQYEHAQIHNLKFIHNAITLFLLVSPCMFRNKDSSGFEHVFVGESRAKEVIGFHNWIQFYLQEKIGSVDYQGYIRGRGVRGVRYNCFRIEYL